MLLVNENPLDPLCFIGHSDIIEGLAVSHDGLYMASGSHDATIRIWLPSDPTGAIQVLKGHGDRIDNVVFTPNGQLLVSTSHDRSIRVWNFLTGAVLQEIDDPFVQWLCLAISPDGLLIAASGYDNEVYLFKSERLHNTEDNIPYAPYKLYKNLTDY